MAIQRPTLRHFGAGPWTALACRGRGVLPLTTTTTNGPQNAGCCTSFEPLSTIKRAGECVL